MTHLRDQFRDLENHHAVIAPDALAAPRRADVTGRVRKSRRIRTVGIATATALLAVGVGAGAWGLVGLSNDEPALPVVTTQAPPSASASESTSPTPSATPEPTMPSFAGTVTIDSRLPSAEAITPEAWNAAGPGWVLATYQEEWTHWDDTASELGESFGPQVAYLISPEGIRYQLTAVLGDEPVKVFAWDPQSSLALTIVSQHGSQGGRWAVLDLTTGATRPVEAADVAASDWERDDVRLAGSFYWSTWEETAGGQFLAALPTIADSRPAADLTQAIATAQGLVAADEECVRALPLATAVAVECGQEWRDDGVSVGVWYAHYFVFVSDGGSGEGTVVDVRIAGEFGNSVLELGRRSTGDIVVADAVEESPYGCPTGRYAVSKSGWVALPGVESIRDAEGSFNIFSDQGVVGTSVFTAITGGCSGDVHPEAMVRDDISDNTYVTLIPLPSAWPIIDGNDWVGASIQGAYVVPSRP